MVIKRTQKTLMGIAIGFVAAVIALVLWSAGILDRWEYTTWTWRVSLLARPGPATTKIKIILLDQASLDWGKEENHWSWPWPREVYAPLIDFCTRGGAKAIIFDVLYTEPSVYGVRDDEALDGGHSPGLALRCAACPRRRIRHRDFLADGYPRSNAALRERLSRHQPERPCSS